MTDSDLNWLIDVAIEQKCLKSLVLKGLTIDALSSEKLCELFESKTLEELEICNVKIHPKYLLQIVTQLAEVGTIQKLTLEQLNLTEYHLIQHLEQLLVRNYDLRHLSLSFCMIKYQHFFKLVQALKDNQSIQSINFSHIDMSYTISHKEEMVKKMVESLEEWIKDFAKCLQHINLTGMNLRGHLEQLCYALSNNKTILSVHLDENDLDTESKNTILRLFGIDNTHYFKHYEESKFNKTDELSRTIHESLNINKSHQF